MKEKYSGFWFLPVLLLTSIFVACGGNADEESPAIASLNSQRFTIDDLQELVPSDRGIEISRVQLQNHVQRWIESELIYQEAIKTGIEELPRVEKRIRDLQKDYVVAFFLEQFLERDLAISEAQIQAFYEENKSEYVRDEDMYNVQLGVFETYREANAIRRQVQNGEDFGEIIAEQSLDTSKEQNGRLGWVTLKQLPEALAASVPRMGIDTPSRPVKTQIGYYVYIVRGVRKAGDTQTLEEVRNLVEWRLRTGKREEKYHQLVNMLMENTEISTNWALLDSVNISTINETKR